MTTRHNFIANPSFESDTAHWTISAFATLSRDTTVHNLGSASGNVVISTGGPSGQFILAGDSTTSGFAVTAGLLYTGAIWWQINTALSVVYNVQIRWLNNTGTLISNSVLGTIQAAGSGTTFGTATAPTGAVTGQLEVIQSTTNTATDTFWIDTAFVDQAAAYNGYFDGSTTDAFYTYTWDGTVNDSTSTATSKPPVPRPAATRIWRLPDLRNGSTFEHLSDIHFGTMYWATFLPNWMNRAQADIEALKVATNAGHLMTGDLINWFVDVSGGPSGTAAIQTTEETAYKAWRDAIKAADGLPWAEVPGNHDMMGVSSDGSGTATSRTPRTAADWAADFGYASANNAWDMGDCRILTVCPDVWSSNTADPSNQYILSTATTDWLDSELSSDGRPTFIAGHVTLTEQYGDAGGASVTSANNPAVYSLIGSHSNLIGWLSGHRHNGIGNSTWAKVMNISGRNIFLVCGPGGGSGQSSDGNAYEGGQFGAHIYASYLTLLDDQTLDIRFRDHLGWRWTYGTSPTETHRLLSLT